MIKSVDWIVVSNPDAGRRKSESKKAKVIEAIHSRDLRCVSVEERSRAEFCTSFAEILKSSPPQNGVIVIGGDGTIHEVANIIHQIRPEVAFGVIPAGTGNDFAIQCGILGRDISDLLGRFHDTEPVSIDVITTSDRICLQILSTGFDAEVSELSRRFPSFLGRLRYMVGLLIELIRLKPIRYEIEIDGASTSRSANMLSCANGRNYGGGMLVSPSSDHQDGLLELIVLHPVSRLELLKVFPKIFNGTHVSHPAFEVVPFRNLKLKADTIAQGDGESVAQRPLRISVGISQLRTWKF